MTPAQRKAIDDAVAAVHMLGLPTDVVRRAEIMAASQMKLIDPIGRVIPRAEDFARLMQSYRNPAMEIFHYFIRDRNGVVVAHRMITSGMLSSSRFALENTIAEIAKDAKRLAPDGDVVSGHNHPSGDPIDSADDRAALATITTELDERGVKHGPHVIIDHDTATILTPNHAERTISREGVKFAKPKSVPWGTAVEMGYPSVRNPQQFAATMAATMRPDAIMVVVLDAQHRIIAVAPIAQGRLAHVEDWLPELIRQTAGSATLIHGREDAVRDLAEYITEAQRRNENWSFPVFDIIGVPASGQGYLSYAEQGQIASRSGWNEADWIDLPLKHGESAVSQVERAREARRRFGGEGETGRVSEKFGVGPGIYQHFYSRLERAIANAPFEKATPEQWKAHLSKDVPAGEREWKGIDRFLETQPEKSTVNKSELTDTVRRTMYGGRPLELHEKGEKLAMPDAERQRLHGVMLRAWEELANLILARGPTNAPWLNFQAASDWARVAIQDSPDVQDAEHTILNRMVSAAPHGDLAAIRKWTPDEQTRFEALWKQGHDADVELDKEHRDETRYGDYTEPGGTHYRELRIMVRPERDAEIDHRILGYHGQVFHTGHFPGDQNILAHVRVKDRVDPDGKKTLFVEEVQSDWHQKGRREGYAKLNPSPEDAKKFFDIPDSKWAELDDRQRQSYAQEMGELVASGKDYEGKKLIPDAPMKKTEEWAGLVVRRLLAEAALHGYDRIAWTNGAQQVDRYDLSKHVDQLRYDSASKELTAYKNGRPVHRSRYEPSQLPDVIGKDATDKLLATKPLLRAGLQDIRARGEPVGVRHLVRHKDTGEYVPWPPPAEELPDYVRAGRAPKWFIEYEKGDIFGTYKDRADAEAEMAKHKELYHLPPTEHHLGGVDLRVGGQGMQQFYDKILPGLFRDEAKKLGVKVSMEPTKVLPHAADIETEYRVLDGAGRPHATFENRNAAEDYRKRLVEQRGEQHVGPIATVQVKNLTADDVTALADDRNLGGT